MSNVKKVVVPTHVGKHGDHPVGGAIGAAVGGAAAAAATAAVQGASFGTAAGLPGMIAGVAIGGVVGALSGKGIAQEVNPTTEDAYWENNYHARPYVEETKSYDYYRPAYHHGVESFTKHEGKPYEEVRAHIEKDYRATAANLQFPWEDAEPATRDAYERLYHSTNDNEKK